MTQYIYAFDEGRISMKNLLGGKGANLSEMKRLGLPVPDGFTITTEACIDYLKQNEQLPTEVKTQLIHHLTSFSERTGKSFSSDEDLLLVSVRSGAKISMPGMMDTILNLGLNDDNVKKLADKTNDARFAYDCYRRLLQMFGEVVYGIPMLHILMISKINTITRTMRIYLLTACKRYVKGLKRFIEKRYISHFLKNH